LVAKGHVVVRTSRSKSDRVDEDETLVIDMAKVAVIFWLMITRPVIEGLGIG
jgi:hypothetical protein